jgi:hypothetical protein
MRIQGTRYRVEVTGEGQGHACRRRIAPVAPCDSCILYDLFSIVFNEARRAIVDNAFLDLALRILGNAGVLWI